MSRYSVAEIARADEKLRGLLATLQATDQRPEAQVVASALEAGLTLLVGIALDLSSIADSLSQIALTPHPAAAPPPSPRKRGEGKTEDKTHGA